MCIFWLIFSIEKPLFIKNGITSLKVDFASNPLSGPRSTEIY